MTQAMPHQPAPQMSPLKVWFLAARPKTLTASLAPISVGTALAFVAGQSNFTAAAFAFLSAMFIQIGTNYANDLFDARSGADDAERLGPQRVTSSGLVTQRQIAIATAVAFGIAFALGMVLVYMTGWPLLVLGVVSILCGVAYTGGPFPLAYNALGDVFVFVFFGLVATAGTYYVQAQEVSWLALYCGSTVGLLGVALLIVNNLRDIPTDSKHDKTTTAVLLGAARTRVFYVLTVLTAYALPAVAVALGWISSWALICLGTLPFALLIMRKLYASEGAQLNAVLGMTALLQLVTSFLLAGGIAL